MVLGSNPLVTDPVKALPFWFQTCWGPYESPMVLGSNPLVTDPVKALPF